jgi:hypothetical protein
MGISNVSSGLRSGVCTSSTRPTAPYEGQMIFETDTHRVLVWDNAAWVMIADTDQPPALSLIRTVSFSSATSASPVSVAGVFTSDYDNYRVVLKYTATASGSTAFQFLNSGGVVSGAFYRGQTSRSFEDVVDGISNFNTSSWGNFAYSFGTNTSYSTLSCDIVSPNLNTPSSATTNFYCDNVGYPSNLTMNGGFMYAAQGVMTGFRIYPNSGNITGSLSVYGYRN